MFLWLLSMLHKRYILSLIFKKQWKICSRVYSLLKKFSVLNYIPIFTAVLQGHFIMWKMNINICRHSVHMFTYCTKEQLLNFLSFQNIGLYYEYTCFLSIFEIVGLDISKEDTSKGYTIWPLISDFCQYQLWLVW